MYIYMIDLVSVLIGVDIERGGGGMSFSPDPENQPGSRKSARIQKISLDPENQPGSRKPARIQKTSPDPKKLARIQKTSPDPENSPDPEK